MTESEQARAKYGAFASTHEIYGVLSEEVAEFFDIVREKTLANHINYVSEELSDKKYRIVAELIQIASVANRAADEIMKGEVKWI
jgi:demethoxyubiquinone hydroxylase (CLK1/Coq7/Cat5 family)